MNHISDSADSLASKNVKSNRRGFARYRCIYKHEVDYVRSQFMNYF